MLPAQVPNDRHPRAERLVASRLIFATSVSNKLLAAVHPVRSEMDKRASVSARLLLDKAQRTNFSEPLRSRFTITRRLDRETIAPAGDAILSTLGGGWKTPHVPRPLPFPDAVFFAHFTGGGGIISLYDNGERTNRWRDKGKRWRTSESVKGEKVDRDGQGDVRRQKRERERPREPRGSERELSVALSLPLCSGKFVQSLRISCAIETRTSRTSCALMLSRGERTLLVPLSARRSPAPRAFNER